MSITFNLTINETKKLNLDDDNYYDLQVFLKDISDYKADLVIKSINEEIPADEKKEIEEKEDDEKIEKPKLWLLILGLIVVIVAVVLAVGYKKKKR